MDFRQWLAEDENLDDFDDELQFAQEIIAGRAKLEDFKYYKDYEITVNKEASLIRGHLLFVGGGPIPMTPILLHQKHGINSDAMDYNSHAVRVSTELLKNLGITGVRTFHGDATTFSGYGSYGTIMLSLEAGTDEALKRKIFDNIKSQINSSTRVLIRGSNTEMFVNVESYVGNYFDVKAKVPSFSNLSTTYLLHCELCPTKQLVPA